MSKNLSTWFMNDPLVALVILGDCLANLTSLKSGNYVNLPYVVRTIQVYLTCVRSMHT